MGTTYFMHVPLSHIPLLTRLYHLHDPTYNASVQESALLYMQGSYRDVLPKNGCGRWSAFLEHFYFFVYRHHCTWLNHVQPLTYAYVRVFEEILQESWPPTAILYVRVHTCSDHVYSMYIHGMYSFTLSWTKRTERKITAKLQLRTHNCLHNSQLP